MSRLEIIRKKKKKEKRGSECVISKEKNSHQISVTRQLPNAAGNFSRVLKFLAFTD